MQKMIARYGGTASAGVSGGVMRGDVFPPLRTWDEAIVRPRSVVGAGKSMRVWPRPRAAPAFLVSRAMSDRVVTCRERGVAGGSSRRRERVPTSRTRDSRFSPRRGSEVLQPVHEVEVIACREKRVMGACVWAFTKPGTRHTLRVDRRPGSVLLRSGDLPTATILPRQSPPSVLEFGPAS